MLPRGLASVESFDESACASSFHKLEGPKCLNRLGGDLTSGRVCGRSTIEEMETAVFVLDTGKSTVDVGDGGACDDFSVC